MFGIGMQELLIILLIALFLFGAKKLPEIGSGLGRAIHNFKRGISEPDHLDIASQGASPEKPSPKSSSPDNGPTEQR